MHKRTFIAVAASAALLAGTAFAQNASRGGSAVDPAWCGWGCYYTNGPATGASAQAPELNAVAESARAPAGAEGRASIIEALATSRPSKRVVAPVRLPKPAPEAVAEVRSPVRRVAAPEPVVRQPKRVARVEMPEPARPRVFRPIAKAPQPRLARVAPPMVEPHAGGLVTRRSVSRAKIVPLETAEPGMVREPSAVQVVSRPDPAPTVVEEVEIRLRPPTWDRWVSGVTPSVAASVGPYGALTK